MIVPNLDNLGYKDIFVYDIVLEKYRSLCYGTLNSEKEVRGPGVKRFKVEEVGELVSIKQKYYKRKADSN